MNLSANQITHLCLARWENDGGSVLELASHESDHFFLSSARRRNRSTELWIDPRGIAGRTSAVRQADCRLFEEHARDEANRYGPEL